jgi:hypothetical protein
MVQPLNPPAAGTPAAVVDAARIASVDALRLAAIACAALLVAGGIANWIGLRPAAGEGEARGAGEPAGGGSRGDREPVEAAGVG